MYKYVTYKINIEYEIIKNKLRNLDIIFFKRILYIKTIGHIMNGTWK